MLDRKIIIFYQTKLEKNYVRWRPSEVRLVEEETPVKQEKEIVRFLNVK